MKKEQQHFSYDVYESVNDLPEEYAALLQQAREVTAKAYAPYSKFLVGAVAKLSNGAIVAGTNQENASYPVGICAERVLLSNASMQHTGIPVDTIAISYDNTNGESDKPISPCGMCRQSLREYEERTKHPIRLILSGLSGKVFVLESAGQLLPLSFGSDDMSGY
jgi:cytidine deaminase